MPASNIETEIDGLQGAGSENGSEASHCGEPHSFRRSGSSFSAAVLSTGSLSVCKTWRMSVA